MIERNADASKTLTEQLQEYKEANDSMFDTIKMLNKDNYKLEAENTKLKDLLKDCRYILEIEKNFPSCAFEKDRLAKLIAKINQVLEKNNG